jgi:acyl-CoA synthetase (AMP-forming)/AMP-acid ligase II
MNYRTIAHRLHSFALHSPSRTAFIYLRDGEADGTSITYEELDKAASRIARTLRAQVDAGGRALLLFPPGIEYITAFFGCLYAGVIAVPAYPPEAYRPRATLPRLRAIAEDCEPSAVLATAAITAASADIRLEIPLLAQTPWITPDPNGGTEDDGVNARPEGPAFIQYTSGSTGDPKGVLVSNANIVANQRVIEAALGLEAGSTFVGWLPLYHDMGLIGNVMHTVHLGATCVLMAPFHFLQRPIRWLRTIARFKATGSAAPNFGYALCTQKTTFAERACLDLSSWRIAITGAEPPRASTLDDFAKAFEVSGFRASSFRPCYGLAESTLMVSCGDSAAGPSVRSLDGSNHGVVSSGLPIAGSEVVIVDPEARVPVAKGEVGEIWVAGDSVALGYWNRPELTNETFRASLPGRETTSFLRTGDLGFVADNNLFVVGRLKETIIVRGRKIHPHDVEETIEKSLPAARGAIAFGVDNGEGEAIALVVAAGLKHGNDDHARALFEAIVRGVTEAHGVAPQTVVLVPPNALLKTSSGKKRRNATREALQQGTLEVFSRWDRQSPPSRVSAA